MSEPTADDAGLDSEADLRILGRILLFGLAALVVVTAIAFLVTRDLALVGILGVAYVLVAASQWYAANKRARLRARS